MLTISQVHHCPSYARELNLNLNKIAVHIEFLPSEESTELLVQKGQLDIRPKRWPKREKSL